CALSATAVLTTAWRAAVLSPTCRLTKPTEASTAKASDKLQVAQAADASARRQRSHSATATVGSVTASTSAAIDSPANVAADIIVVPKRHPVCALMPMPS